MSQAKKPDVTLEPGEDYQVIGVKNPGPNLSEIFPDRSQPKPDWESYGRYITRRKLVARAAVAAAVVLASVAMTGVVSHFVSQPKDIPTYNSSKSNGASCRFPYPWETLGRDIDSGLKLIGSDFRFMKPPAPVCGSGS